MNRITEALKSFLPQEHANEAAKILDEMMAEHEAKLKASYDQRLSEAYDNLAEQVEEIQNTAYRGYKQAHEIINDLMKRLEIQREQLENEKEQGFEEAFAKLKATEAKNENLEVALYEEFDNKLKQMKNFIIDKVDVFLGEQESEIYGEAMRNVLSDPRILEQRVAVEKMAEVLSGYMTGKSANAVSSRKLEEAMRTVEDLRGQLRVVESRNVKLSMQNNNLTEQVREASSLITEAQKHERQNRAVSKKNASGRGHRVANEQLITEFNDNRATNKNQRVINEGDEFADLLILSGLEEIR